MFGAKVFLIFACLHTGFSINWPFRRCHVKDNQCLINAMQDAITKLLPGLPKIGMPPISPFEIPVLNITGGSGVVKVDQYFKNVKFWGFKDATVDNVVADLDKKQIVMELTLKNCTLEGNYIVNGQVLLLPVVGNGHSTINLANLHMTHTLQAEDYKKHGSIHYKIIDYKINFSPVHVEFNFENLFNGDKILGDAMNKVLNENWEEIFKDVQQGYESAFAQIFVQLANRVFGLMPLKDIFVLE